MRKIAIFALALILLFAFGCTTQAQDKGDASTNSTKEVQNPYAGSCINDKQCTTPSCGAWIDSDNDGACDRGE